MNNNKNQKDNLAEDKKKIEEINDNYFKNNDESQSPDKKRNIDRVQEIKIYPKDVKDFILPKVKIVDVKKEEKVNLIQKNPEKLNKLVNNHNQANSENENELIEKHKLLINLNNIEKGIDVDEIYLETEVEKIETEDVNSCTRDFNVVVVYRLFKNKRITIMNQLMI